MLDRCIAIIALLASLAGGAVLADQNEPALDPLFEDLAAADVREKVLQVEKQIWHIWLDSGEERVNQELSAGILAMSRGRIETSIRHFTRVTEMAPDFAEGWNKRATAYYLNDELANSMRDIQKTLALEPRHFGAISGMGLIFLQRGDERGALKAFEQVLKIHPMAPGANAQVDRLRKKLDGQGV